MYEHPTHSWKEQQELDVFFFSRAAVLDSAYRAVTHIAMRKPIFNLDSFMAFRLGFSPPIWHLHIRSDRRLDGAAQLWTKMVDNLF